MQIRIAALIAAAGESKRMGRSKAFLEIGNTTFIEAIAGALRDGGIRQIVVTLPDRHFEETKVTQGLEKRETLNGFTFPLLKLRNNFPHRELLGSVQSALSKLNAQALLICPVDMPFLTPDLVSRFLMQPLHEPALVVATHKEKTGHPLLITHHFFKEIVALNDGESMRVILERHEDRLSFLESNDPRVLVNINTPEDYARFTKPSLRIFDAAATDAPGVKLE